MKKAALIALALAGCGARDLDAVTGRSCLEQPEQAACSKPVWPNAYSRTNSDRWLEAHADDLRSMRPRLLVLNFHNALSPDELAAVVDRQVDLIGEGTRYHGFSDPDAPTFIAYERTALVDLRDDPPPADWTFTSSTRVPLDDAGVFDVAALFAEPYTSLIGVEDPDLPGRTLDLCQQFERGLVNELWLAVGDTVYGREPFPMIECKAARDAAGKRTVGDATATAGGSICAQLPPCDVTIRIAHLSPLRGPGCDLFVRGWAIQGSQAAIPYLKRNAARFFNADLDRRYGAPVPNLLALCPPNETACLGYPTASALESVLEAGPKFRIDDYGQGCGTVEFPPNARFISDWDNPQVVDTRCEHYALGDGDDGDLPSPYSADTVAGRDASFDDCGGAWQLYWRQNMPGLDNRALADDGTPMKNWWPFLFF